MQQIYLDNASTTFPKPQAVADAVYQYITHAGTNISRGTCAAAGENLVFAAREQLCRFFGGEDSKNVVFTKNITESPEGKAVCQRDIYFDFILNCFNLGADG